MATIVAGMTDLGAPFNRRTLLRGSAAGALALTTGALAARPTASAALVRGRIQLPSGVQTGDVTTHEAVLWARADRPGRLVARVTSGGRARTVRGPWATPAGDLTAKIPLRGLAPGREYDARLAFEDADGNLGELRTAQFSTAAVHPARTSFVWTGDTCGQGWGINPDLGGLVGYRAMHDTRPDFFIHAGDTIYADGPISAEVIEPDGQVWRNLVTEEVSKVAETLTEFRGRHRYNLMDANVRAMYADVPVIAQWDDHETTNNWFPGEILDDARYTQERRVDVLARRARQAWQENMPIADPRSHHRSDGFAPARIYRKIARGPQLDVFCLDMRTFKDPNTPGLEQERTSILGQEQVDWLIREVTRSKATWKVIAADLPLGVVVPDGPVDQESIANREPGAPLGKELELAAVLSAFKRHRCAQRRVDHRRRALLRGAPLRPGARRFHRLRPVLGVRRRADRTPAPSGPTSSTGPSGRRCASASTPIGRTSRRGTATSSSGTPRSTRDGLLTISLRDTGGNVLFSQDLQPESR